MFTSVYTVKKVFRFTKNTHDPTFYMESSSVISTQTCIQECQTSPSSLSILKTSKCRAPQTKLISITRTHQPRPLPNLPHGKLACYLDTVRSITRPNSLVTSFHVKNIKRLSSTCQFTSPLQKFKHYPLHEQKLLVPRLVYTMKTQGFVVSVVINLQTSAF